MAVLIDGKKISQEIKDELKEEVSRLKGEGKHICLAVVQVGNDPASTVYVNNKKKACAYIGIESQSYELLESTSEEELVDLESSCSCRFRHISMKTGLYGPFHRIRMWTVSIRSAWDVCG